MKKIDEDALLKDLTEEFTSDNPDKAVSRMEELDGYDVDDLPL